MKSVVVDGKRTFPSAASFTRWLKTEGEDAPSAAVVWRACSSGDGVVCGHRVEYLERRQARRIRELEAATGERCRMERYDTNGLPQNVLVRCSSCNDVFDYEENWPYCPTCGEEIMRGDE